jgi:hypothetical protein
MFSLSLSRSFCPWDYMTRLHFRRCQNGICLPPDRPVPLTLTFHGYPTDPADVDHSVPPYPDASPSTDRICPQSAATQGRHGETAHGSGDQKPADAERERKANLPSLPPRAMFLNERITPLVTQQPSRIPELARHILPVSRFYCSVMPAFILCQGSVHNRTTRQDHPPSTLQGKSGRP